MASNKSVKEADVLEVVEVVDSGAPEPSNYAVEEVPQEIAEPNPSGVRYVEVDEVEPVTRTSNFLSGHGPLDKGGVVDLGPVVVNPDQETYKIRVIEDIEPVFLGPSTQLPAFRKGVLYEVPKRVYDYLVPKGLVEGR